MKYWEVIVTSNKISAEMQGHIDGMRYALTIAQQGGIEALEDEINRRHLMGLSLNVTSKDMLAAQDEWTHQAVEMMLPAALLALHDEFGFGADRGRRFLQRFESNITEMTTDSRRSGVTVSDYLETLKAEMGIDLSGHKPLIQ